MSKIDYSQVIENEEELEIYQRLTLEIQKFLRNNGATKFNTLVRYVGGSDRRMLRLLDQMVKEQILDYRNKHFILSNTPEPKIKQTDIGCPTCHGLITGTNFFSDSQVEFLNAVIQSRPTTTFIFDQRPVTLDTTLRRAAYMAWRGDLQNQDIAVIGDDDLTGIAIALTGMAKSVTVFDIDQRLIDYIARVSAENDLKIQCRILDVTKDVPEDVISDFDVFTTDPTPARIPFTVFVNVGIKLLRKNGIGYLSFYSSAMKLTSDFQEVLSQMKLIITDLIPFFTEYAFVPQTFSADDYKLLKKYSNGISEMSFYEHLCRTVKTEKTNTISLTYKMSDMFGKATRRSLKNIDSDPAIENKANQEYLFSMAKTINESKDKEIKSGE